MKRKTETSTIVPILITLFVLLFGDNIYEQITGHSIFTKTLISTDQPTEESFLTLQTPIKPQGTQSIPPTILSTMQLPVMLMEHRLFEDFGSSDLVLTSSQVAIGTADRFNDVIDVYNPQYTIFVVYGEINTQVNLFWGGWDLWENASDRFIENQIELKIDEVKANHESDYATRGYRVIKCYGQVENCETIITFP